MTTPTSIGAEAARREPAAATVAGGRLDALRRLFSLRSLRTRLVLGVLAIDLVAAALTGAVIVLKARTATKVEIASSIQLAEEVVSDSIRLLQDAPAPLLLKSIDLHFQPIRHVRIEVADAAGRAVFSAIKPDIRARQDVSNAPAWFSFLIAPPVETRNFPVIIRGESTGVVTIRSEPSDEIGEAWNYAYALIVTTFCLNIMVLGALFIFFGRVLAPLPRLVAGLKDLEIRNYAVRLPRPSLVELAIITDHFNKAAEALSAAHEANRRLTRKLLTAQDDERRRMALELHDEAGACLFALEVNATSILNMTKHVPDGARIGERAKDVVALVETVQGINRRVLDRLRPMALGQIPLKECLIKLLVDLDGGEGGPAIDHAIGDLRTSYGPLVDLTIYRCVQEGLLNAIRHAHASRIMIALDEREEAGRSSIEICIRDDGIGLQPPLRAGVGLSGMRERVEALSGSFAIKAGPGGLTLAIALPLDGVEAQDKPPASPTFD
jgi:two-component system, NarL family, sensor histidine kinase UhpB